MQTIIAIIGALGSVTAAVGAMIALRVSRKVDNVHLMMNSRFDEWIAATRIASFAEGKKAAEDEQQDERNEKGRE